MRDYKWGILAPGTIANNFAKGLSTIPNAVLYAVGSRDTSRAQEFAGKYGIQKAYGSYEELAKDPDIDMIYVATPHPQHEEATILCLNNGKHVLCEKPFAVNATQASRMIEGARKNKVFLMEAMWTRFLPSICKVRELIAEDAIGKIQHVDAAFCFRAGLDPKSRLFSPHAAGGSLLDVGVYNLSLCSMIFKKQPASVQSYLNIGSTKVDETASVLLSYEGGESALLISSIRLNTPHDASIYGEDGYIKLPGYWGGDTVLLCNKDGKQEIKLPFESSGFQYETMEMMKCVDKGLLESPILPLDETLAIMKIMDKIRQDNNLQYPFEA